MASAIDEDPVDEGPVDQGPVDQGMAALRRDYVARLRVTLAGLELDFEAWRAGDEEAGLRARRTAHRLYGSGATYGYPALSDAAETFEQSMRWNTAPEDAIFRGAPRAGRCRACDRRRCRAGLTRPV